MMNPIQYSLKSVSQEHQVSILASMQLPRLQHRSYS